MLAKQTIIDDFFDKGIVTKQMQKAAKRAVIRLLMIQSATDVLLMEDQLTGLIVSFMSG